MGKQQQRERIISGSNIARGLQRAWNFYKEGKTFQKEAGRALIALTLLGLYLVLATALIQSIIHIQHPLFSLPATLLLGAASIVVWGMLFDLYENLFT